MRVRQGDELKHYKTVWMENGLVKMIDQHLLPQEFKIVEYKDYIETSNSITDMTVRGAGAIGATAAYATAQLAIEAESKFKDNNEAFWNFVHHGMEHIRRARPTANALFEAVDQVYDAMLKADSPTTAKVFAVSEARNFADSDARSCRAIGKFGADEIQNYMQEKNLPAVSILTHCNAGWLAFVDYGSALSPIYELNSRGIKVNVFADETRPYNQGSRLTAWELHNEGIEVEIVPDNHVGALMSRNLVDLVIVGADRIAANGDTANKVGTYVVATMAKSHNIPFYVAAPRHTFDLCLDSGEKIPIEERSSDEVNWIKGTDRSGNRTEVKFAADGVSSRYIAFDVTPHYLIKSYITDHGVLKFFEIRDRLGR